MALLHEEDYKGKRSEKGAEGRHSSEPEKAHLTGEFTSDKVWWPCVVLFSLWPFKCSQGERQVGK